MRQKLGILRHRLAGRTSPNIIANAIVGLIEDVTHIFVLPQLGASRDETATPA